jgi:class 3 adenylate cyclase/tetratricopeptide (TPR) repeat protein
VAEHGIAALAAVAERRLVSVLFADLVGFTKLAEGRDPEAVRELLSAYFELATDVINRYGGTVEKFIGDAVMALWGAPTAHEDDAERAVRAGLDLVEAVRALGPGVEARCGVLTGEAAVTLGARDQGMVAGDLVNTASRLQSVAPPGVVLVGEATQRATSGAIAFEAAGEQLLKGKAAPVPAWRALRIVAERRGRGRDDRLEAPFVGRDAELRLLKDLFHATSRERRVRLVSITGQGGIGKSRLAWEFLKYVDGVVESVWWHEGRSPAYGEGITFWALGEMVRSRAGLLESDDPDTTRARIADIVVEHVPDEAERRRIEPALLALLGVGEAPAGGAAELFSAWRTFFERLAATGVVALLFEDLQWADPGTLDFIEHMLEWSRNVPVLIITLARPELLEKRPGWGAGKRAFLALDLQPLDEPSMRALLGGLVAGLPEPAVQSIVARAEGIPLYAVETIRMLVADGRLVAREGGGYEPEGELGELAVPNTLHALIAARLDGLDQADRALVQEAAVLGQSFTQDALVAVAGIDPVDAGPRLERLVRLELMRREVDPRSPERGQYAFVQALIREVAYSTLSLRDRRARHLAAARHFESLGDEELAGALAAHYVAAYRASAEGPEAEALASQARVSLRAAADRAFALGAPGQAMTFLEQAIEVTPDPAEGAELHERAALAAMTAARNEIALGHYEAAATLFADLGDRSGEASAIARRGWSLTALRRREEARTLLEAAWTRFQDLGDDAPALVLLAQTVAAVAMQVGDYDRALDMSERALAAAERLGLAEHAAETLNIKGTTLFYRGRQWEARALLIGARQVAEEAGLSDTALRVMVMLPSFIALDDPRGSLVLQQEAIALARRLGRRGIELGILFNATEDARRTGDWDWAVTETSGAAQLDLDQPTLLGIRSQLAFFAAYRGSFDERELDGIREAIEALDDRDLYSGIYDLAASYAHAEGRWAEATAAWLKVGDFSDLNAPYALPKAGRSAILARDPASAQAALDQLAALGTRGRAVDADRTTIRAGLAALGGDSDAARAGYRTALAAYRDLGLAWDQALLGLEAAWTLGTSDPEVAAWVDGARAIFLRLQAGPMLDRLAEAVHHGNVVAPGESSLEPAAPAAGEPSAAGESSAAPESAAAPAAGSPATAAGG